MPTKRQLGYWITPEGQSGSGEILVIDPRDLSERMEKKVNELMDKNDYAGLFYLVKNKITLG